MRWNELLLLLLARATKTCTLRWWFLAEYFRRGLSVCADKHAVGTPFWCHGTMPALAWSGDLIWGGFSLRRLVIAVLSGPSSACASFELHPLNVVRACLSSPAPALSVLFSRPRPPAPPSVLRPPHRLRVQGPAGAGRCGGDCARRQTRKRGGRGS